MNDRLLKRLILEEIYSALREQTSVKCDEKAAYYAKKGIEINTEDFVNKVEKDLISYRNAKPATIIQLNNWELYQYIPHLLTKMQCLTQNEKYESKQKINDLIVMCKKSINHIRQYLSQQEQQKEPIRTFTMNLNKTIIYLTNYQNSKALPQPKDLPTAIQGNF